MERILLAIYSHEKFDVFEVLKQSMKILHFPILQTSENYYSSWCSESSKKRPHLVTNTSVMNLLWSSNISCHNRSLIISNGFCILMRMPFLRITVSTDFSIVLRSCHTLKSTMERSKSSTVIECTYMARL